MIATIVYSNTAHEDQPRCIQSPYPNVCEFNNVKNLRYKIIDLQYFLYRPNYILVEFCGKIYDATNFNSEESKELLRKIDDWLR
jgi:hypothetical protein